jgi:hypothetical protein
LPGLQWGGERGFDVIFKAITICQPHAWAVLQPGMKPYENRRWASKYVGSLLIHAGLSRKWLDELYDGQPADDQLVFGAIIGVVNMRGSIPITMLDIDKSLRHPTASGPWLHVYESPRTIASPIPCPGALSLWEPSVAIVDEVLAQLPELAESIR